MEAARSALQSISSPDQINHDQAAQKYEIARTSKVKSIFLGWADIQLLPDQSTWDTERQTLRERWQHLAFHKTREVS